TRPSGNLVSVIDGRCRYRAKQVWNDTGVGIGFGRKGDVMRRSFYRWAMFVLTALSIVGCGSTAGQGGGANASSLTYASPVALASGSQAACSNLHYKSGSKARIAYMPPATEFDYYIA